MNKQQFVLNRIKRKIQKIFSKRKTYIFLSYFLILVILFFMLYEPIMHSSIFGDEKNSLQKQQSYYQKSIEENNTPITYSEIPEVLSNQQIIKDLPKDTTLLLKFYNFTDGERQWEHSFILKKGKVVDGETNSYDLFLYIHSKYLQTFRSQGLCGTIQNANNRGDLGVETTLSNTALTWKFKNMLNYRDCLGI